MERRGCAHKAAIQCKAVTQQDICNFNFAKSYAMLVLHTLKYGMLHNAVMVFGRLSPGDMEMLYTGEGYTRFLEAQSHQPNSTGAADSAQLQLL